MSRAVPGFPAPCRPHTAVQRVVARPNTNGGARKLPGRGATAPDGSGRPARKVTGAAFAHGAGGGVAALRRRCGRLVGQDVGPTHARGTVAALEGPPLLGSPRPVAPARCARRGQRRPRGSLPWLPSPTVGAAASVRSDHGRHTRPIQRKTESRAFPQMRIQLQIHSEPFLTSLPPGAKAPSTNPPPSRVAPHVPRVARGSAAPREPAAAILFSL